MECSEAELQKRVPMTKEEAEIRKLVLTDEGLSNIHYNLLLVLRSSKDKTVHEGKCDFEGKIEIVFDYYQKDLDKENVVQHVKESPLFLNFVGQVESLEINGQAVNDFVFKNNKLELDVKRLGDITQNTVTVLFYCKYSKAGTGLHHYTDTVDGKEYIYSQFEVFDCCRVFPCFDQPDLKAVLELTIVAPEEWTVISNEFEKEISKLGSINALDSLRQLSDREKDHLFGQTQIYKKNYVYHTFYATPKISTYLYAICAGPYQCINNHLESEIPLRIFYRESLKGLGEPEELFRVTIAGYKWYKHYFGVDFPFSKYDQIFCPEYNCGAMENVGAVTFNEFYWWKDKPTQRHRTSLAITVLHELAHMWFGNLVTMKWWDDLWLNESFADFISHLCLANSAELNISYPISWLMFNNSKGGAYRADQQTTTHPVMSEVKNTDVAETHFDEIVYQKGASILKQIYYYVGDENFSKGLKSYFVSYMWSNTTFDDFINKLIQAAHKPELRELCNNWLRKAGLNEIEAQIKIDSNEKIQEFVIKQTPCLTQHPNLQTHMCDILFIDNVDDMSANRVFKNVIIKNQEKTSLGEFIGITAPKAVVLNYSDYAYFKWVIDKLSLGFFKDNLNKIDDLLTKQCIYRSIYDLTRDSKLSCVEYIDIVSASIRKETNEDIICSSLRNVQAAIRHFIPLKYFEKYSAIMFECISDIFARELNAYYNLKSSNKELILHLIRFSIAFAFSEENIEKLKTWLTTESPSVNGITFEASLLSQQNRFDIVNLIFTSRKISLEEKEKLLAAEIQRDNNSDRSVTYKLACYASRPEKEIKEELWNKFVNQPNSDSLVNMQTLMGNFAFLNQLDLVEDYLKNKFFHVLYDLSKNNDMRYIESFIGNLAPFYFLDEESITKMESLADKVKEFDHANRSILEKIDDMKRCLKAQNLSEEYLKQKL